MDERVLKHECLFNKMFKLDRILPVFRYDYEGNEGSYFSVMMKFQDTFLLVPAPVYSLKQI